MHKENESTAQFAIQNLILDLFPELDNFDRALKLADNSKDIDKFVEGIKLVEDQLFKVLGKYGVKSMETVGKAFDPNLHEAVMEEENNELPHHTITDELQRGFLLKERVIRPSKVKVSKEPLKKRKQRMYRMLMAEVLRLKFCQEEGETCLLTIMSVMPVIIHSDCFSR